MSQLSPKDLSLPLEEQGGKRYKVAVIQMRADLYTIWAKDPSEAVQLVTAGGDGPFKDRMGREAGFEGPVVVSAMAREMADGDNTPFLPLFIDAISPKPHRSTNVEVPQLVLPSGVRV